MQGVKERYIIMTMQSKSFRAIWVSSRENLSSGFPTLRDSNKSPRLQRLARKLNFRSYEV